MKIQKYKPNDEINCPHCQRRIRFYRFSGMANMCPHFYCDTCSNVIHRRLDYKRIFNEEPSQALLDEISETLPRCPCGGQFKPGSNPKCPNCKKELKHQWSPVDRLDDLYAIVVEGSKLLTDE